MFELKYSRKQFCRSCEAATETQTRKHYFFWLVLSYCVIFAFLFVYICAVVFQFGAVERNRGWSCSFESQGCRIHSIDPRSPASKKLKNGDVIIAVNGQTDFKSYTIQDHKAVLIPRGPFYTLTVQRDGSVVSVQIESIEKRDLSLLFSILAILLAALTHLLVSVFVGLSRPAVKTVRLFALSGITLAVSLLAFSLTRIEEFAGHTQLRISFLCMLFSFVPISVPISFHFFSRFPADFDETPFWAFFRRLLYVCGIAIAASFTVFRFLMVLDPVKGAAFAFRHWDVLYITRHASELTGFCAIAGVGFVTLRNYRSLADWDNKRRIRWVFYGGLLGILPLGFYYLGNVLRFLNFAFAPSQSRLDAMIPVSILSLVLIPISVAYAILKSRIFDLHIVVRRGVQYLFAKRFLQLLIYFPLAWMIYTIRSNPHRTVADLISTNTSYLFLVIAAAAGFLFRKNILDSLDRRFFREAYNSENILLTLADEIQNFNSISEVAGWVSRQLDTALHPARIIVFYKQKGRKDFSLAYSSGSGNSTFQIPDSFKSVMIAQTQAKSVNLSSNELNLPDAEVSWLREAGINLIVPMLGSDEFLYGMLLMGEKKSEEPYSANDRKLLEALARQMGVLYENLLLKDQVFEDQRIRRDVLSHLAAEQRNLLKECPKCGACYDSSEEECKYDQTELILTLPVDRVIDEKYRLDRLIGKGGMGAVYQAGDLRLSRDVAIKLLLGEKFGDSQALKRFAREARASARLNHPNVISIHDFGDLGKGAYIVMELLQGYSLREALVQWKNIPPDTAADWFNQILEGVKSAHLHGIVHRDLKPENVIITRDGMNQPLVKILDFGLAKMTLAGDVHTKTLTQPGMIMGTLSYMSPEQIAGGEVDERTDIFTLGVMAVEAVTGKLPFTGKTAQEVAIAILQRPVLLETNSANARTFNEVIQKCVAKNRELRFASIAEMQKPFIDAIRSAPVSTKPNSPLPDIQSTRTEFPS